MEAALPCLLFFKWLSDWSLILCWVLGYNSSKKGKENEEISSGSVIKEFTEVTVLVFE